MMKRFAAALAISAGLLAAPAFAQAPQPQTPSHVEGSGQGGYLGVNPGTSARPTTPPQLGSMQGGYLGKNPGADSQPRRAPGTLDASSPPTAFCEAYSLDQDRCKGRATADHQMCADKHDMSYMDCRRLLDLFGWRI
jgi:hypothetical protein